MTRNWTNTSAPPPDAYTPEQEDEFRDVFYTMQDTDVAGWVRSLQLRGIALPENIKDEVFLIIGERRLTPPFLTLHIQLLICNS